MTASAAKRLAVVVACAAALTACSTGKADENAPAAAKSKASGTIKLTYLQKQGDQQYFVDQANGAKAAAKQLGAEVTVVNLGSDSNAAISQMNTAVAQGVDGLIIVVPDQQVGPQVIDIAKEAKVPLLASDDIIKSGSGEAAPFVGFDGVAMGAEVGKKAGELFKQAGWNPADTRVLRVSKEDLSVCEDRVNSAGDAFKQASGADVKILKVGSDASVVGSQDKAAAVITANRGVKHWVVYGCNDESETGAVTALQNSGVKADDIIGVGLGAYLTCKDWKAGKATGNKAALYISGEAVGKAAVQAMVKAIREGSALPPQTIAPTTMVDAKTYASAGVNCS
jgi:L-arabinose transport system substrate-binding protein